MKRKQRSYAEGRNYILHRKKLSNQITWLTTHGEPAIITNASEPQAIIYLKRADKELNTFNSGSVHRRGNLLQSATIPAQFAAFDP